MKNVIVKTQALKKYYQTGNQTVRALDGVNFEVAEREFVSIVGKSGSGKSTLLLNNTLTNFLFISFPPCLLFVVLILLIFLFLYTCIL